MATYKIADFVVASTEPGFQAALEMAYNDKIHPICLCREPGSEMYISRVNEHYVIKRWPNSANKHTAECDSYEPPPEMSGLGDVLGSAIKDDEETGTTTLKFDFTLSKRLGSGLNPSKGGEGSSVRTDGKKLTLRGTLHYLYEEAGLNKWHPGMFGKRNWAVIHKHLLEAAATKETKGKNLTDVLYIPEPFRSSAADEIATRRTQHLLHACGDGTGPQDLMLLIGEVKDFQRAQGGMRMIVKHAPGYPFLLNQDIYERLNERFGAELQIWAALGESCHLLTIATFAVNRFTNIARLEEMSVMVTTENWIPIESLFEKELVDKLTRLRREYLKVLRYNLDSSVPLASAILRDTKPDGYAMYIPPEDRMGDIGYRKQLEELFMHGSLLPWWWVPGTSMPDFPEAGLVEERKEYCAPLPPMPVDEAELDESMIDAAAPLDLASDEDLDATPHNAELESLLNGELALAADEDFDLMPGALDESTPAPEPALSTPIESIEADEGEDEPMPPEADTDALFNEVISPEDEAAWASTKPLRRRREPAATAGQGS